MSDPKHPAIGDRTVDLSDIEVIDITPDHIAHLTKLRDGHEGAIANIINVDPAARKRAGLSEDEVIEIAARWAKCLRIDEVTPAVEKLLELLRETRLVEGHELAMRIGEMAHQIRWRAERSAKGTEIMAPFEVLLDYHFALGQLAAAAREKNKKNPPQSPPQSPPQQGPVVEVPEKEPV